MTRIKFDGSHVRDESLRAVVVYGDVGDNRIAFDFTDIGLNDYFNSETDTPELAEKAFVKHRIRLLQVAQLEYDDNPNQIEDGRLVINKEMLVARKP